LKRNPIERRVDILQDQWNAFAADDDARLFIWGADQGEHRIIDTFITKENSAEASETPDVFIRLSTPFADVQEYGAELRDELIDQYQETVDKLAENPDPDVDLKPWTALAPQSGVDNITALLATLEHFHEHHLDADGRLAIWLTPADVGDLEAFRNWLHVTVSVTPACIRFVTVDAREAPLLTELYVADEKKIIFKNASLDMSGAMEEIADQATDRAQPSGIFRKLFAQISNAATEGDAAGAAALGQNATKLALDNSWPHMAGVIQSVLAGIFLSVKDTKSAIAYYQEADVYGEQAVATGKPEPGTDDLRPMGYQISYQARAGLAGVLLSEQDYANAGQIYLSAVDIAKKLTPVMAPLAVLDCWRMASFCNEQDKKYEAAWEHGINGLNHGAEMDEDQRSVSTLGYLCEGLWRLTGQQQYSEHRETMEDNFVALLGENWRPDPNASGEMPATPAMTGVPDAAPADAVTPEGATS